ncbi:MAG: hypothetical protein P1U90_11070 [Akkermansiaceae bacterium]|jgi:hypothetical protein|nr:hypothetical protein [Akkermansiaceae bacterium]
MGKNELIESLRKLPREEQLSVIDEVIGWSHRGRAVQRVIAAILVSTGTVWAYGWMFDGSGPGSVSRNASTGMFLESGLAWWIPLGGSVIALCCEFWVLRAMRSRKRAAGAAW